jgi:hypothetical protein
MPRSLFGASRRARILRLAAVLLIAVGFADLVRGGTTLAPIALVIGYLVIAPLSLLID